MTREEAIEYLIKLYMKANITDAYGDMDDTEPYETALEMAIKALEQPERKHGYWKYAEFLYAFICSNCGRSAISCYDYCPCCGAEMRMKDEN